jgi:hypothetical protein
MLPAFGFWFSGSALFTIGSFALFAVLGFVGIASMKENYRKWMISGYVVASILFVLGWWQTARQEEASANVTTTLGTLQSTLKRIADSANLTANQSVASLANEIIAKLNSKLAPLQPRNLAPLEISKLEAAARDVCPIRPRIWVTAANGNQEAQAYASEFVRIFNVARCDSDLGLPIPGLRPDVVGLHIGVRDVQHIPSEAGALAQILSAGGIKFDIDYMEPNFFPEAQFVLVVGAKAQ